MLEGRTLFDISPVVNSRIAVFPGDTPFEENFLMNTKNGENITLSYIKTTVHLGAHTDAPNHYSRDGVGMHARALEYYIGSCQVIQVAVPRGSRIRVSDLKGQAITAPRVLFRTGTFPNPHSWNSDFASLSGELVDHLAGRKVKLVGIDTPSIDPAEDKVLESHQSVARHDMAILEGIVLDHVASGTYDLVALPLKLEGADASPVRAILLR